MAKRVEQVDRLVGQNLRLSHREGNSESGNAIGVTLQQVQKYENLVDRVSSSRLAQIAKILDIPVSPFFDNSANGTDLPMVTELLITP